MRFDLSTINNMGQKARRAALVVVTGALASPAFAAIDTTAVTADLADAKTAVLAIGVAVLAVVVGVKLYKWVKQAL